MPYGSAKRQETVDTGVHSQTAMQPFKCTTNALGAPTLMTTLTSRALRPLRNRKLRLALNPSKTHSRPLGVGVLRLDSCVHLSKTKVPMRITAHGKPSTPNKPFSWHSIVIHLLTLLLLPLAISVRNA